MIRNPKGMDADWELQGCIYAISNYKAVLALGRAIHINASFYYF
jgi:hypothetical protein